MNNIKAKFDVVCVLTPKLLNQFEWYGFIPSQTKMSVTASVLGVQSKISNAPKDVERKIYFLLKTYFVYVISGSGNPIPCSNIETGEQAYWRGNENWFPREATIDWRKC